MRFDTGTYMSTVADARALPAPLTVAGIVWTPTRLRALRHGLWFAAFLYCIASLGWALSDLAGVDAHAYWSAWRHGLYSAGPEQRDAYLYSPVFAQVLWPLTLLPWPAFYGLWAAAAVAAFAWLLAPLGLRWAIPLILICMPEIEAGNVWPFFALVLVLGFRFPAAWSFPVLLKVTPGVGVLWFAARREWRRAVVAIVVALGIAGVSFAFAPGLWAEWIRPGSRNVDPAAAFSGRRPARRGTSLERSLDDLRGQKGQASTASGGDVARLSGHRPQRGRAAGRHSPDGSRRRRPLHQDANLR